MSTITISLSGSALTGLTTGAGPIQKAYNVTDAQLQQVLNWAQVAFATQLTTAPTNPQIMVAWLQGSLVNGTIQAVQQFNTTPPVVPTAISIA
jgi:hypothetical protein